jgi:hypothetical protein
MEVNEFRTPDMDTLEIDCKCGEKLTIAISFVLNGIASNIHMRAEKDKHDEQHC